MHSISNSIRRSPRFVVTALTAWLIVLASVAGARAQQVEGTPPVLDGTVHRGGEPIADVAVTLHRVDSQSSGEVASTRTGPGGGFTFPLEQPPEASFAVFFVTADYLGVRFFGRPVHASADRTGYALEVFDTTYALPEPIRVSRRDIVLIPEMDGAWEFNEVMRILNPSSLALTAEPGRPTWAFQIPPSATDFQAGECMIDGDIASVLPHEVSQMEDRVLILAPLIPGHRDLCIRYRVPAAPQQAQLLLETPTDTLNLFVRQPSHLSSVTGMASTRMIEAEGERFLQYAATDLLAGSQIRLQWTRAGGAPVNPIVVGLAITLALLALGLWAALRNRSSPGT